MDKDTNRTYSWDRYVRDLNQSSIKEWIMKKQYRDSILQFETPVSLNHWDISGLQWWKWAHESLGQQFHNIMFHSNWRHVFFFFTDNDNQSDPLLYKCERFTVFALCVISVLSVVYGIPLVWYILKLIFSLFTYCCTYEIIEEVDEDELEEADGKE